MRRAESLAGIDLDDESVRGCAIPVVAAMHEEAPGFDRTALAL